MSTKPSQQLKTEDFVSKIECVNLDKLSKRLYLFNCISIQLNSWKESLHPDLIMTLATKNTTSPQKIMLHLLYWTAFMMLHKPFVRPRKQLIYSADKEIDHYKVFPSTLYTHLDSMANYFSLAL